MEVDCKTQCIYLNTKIIPLQCLPGVGRPGDDLGLLSLEEASWADEGESGGLLAVGEVDGADHLVELLLWASL